MNLNRTVDGTYLAFFFVSIAWPKAGNPPENSVRQKTSRKLLVGPNFDWCYQCVSIVLTARIVRNGSSIICSIRIWWEIKHLSSHRLKIQCNRMLEWRELLYLRHIYWLTFFHQMNAVFERTNSKNSQFLNRETHLLVLYSQSNMYSQFYI